MKRVLLLGDSIRLGYGKYVRKMPEEECEGCGFVTLPALAPYETVTVLTEG